MKKFPLYIVMVIMFSCEKEKITSKVYYDTIENSNRKVNLADKIRVTIDTLTAPTDIETSFKGNFTVCNKTIVFADVFFGYLFEFDKKLKLHSKKFGIGNHPHELKGADYMTYSKKTKRLYVLSSKKGILAVINSKIQKEKEFKINFNVKRTREDVINEPLPYLMDSYELDYGYDGILKVFDEYHLAIAITSSHPKFNGYFNSKFYYENSRIIALINIEKEYIDRLIGRRPLLFLKNQLPNYDHFNYEINNNTIYLNFYPEATIYKIDKEKDVVQSTFGIQGSEMKTNYTRTYSYEEAYKREFEDYNNYNFYNSLYVDDNLIFRGYSKYNTKKDGLQIYKNDVLIADLNFPKGYKIIGKIDNAYYASKNVINRREDMVLLKLKFSEL
jgi:hypothetical protein